MNVVSCSVIHDLYLVGNAFEEPCGELDRILQLSSMLTRQGLPVRLELREDASLVQA